MTDKSYADEPQSVSELRATREHDGSKWTPSHMTTIGMLCCALNRMMNRR